MIWEVELWPKDRNADHERVCADCWEQWLRRDSIKVINEGHLDLSTEQGQTFYDHFMRETLGLT